MHNHFLLNTLSLSLSLSLSLALYQNLATEKEDGAEMDQASQ